MSFLREPKVEPEDASEPHHHQLRSGPVTDAICKTSVSPASGPIEAKDEIEEDAWEAIEDGPLVAETPAESEQKCFVQAVTSNARCAAAFAVRIANDMQNHIARRRNGRYKTVKRRQDGRRNELLTKPGRKTIFVEDTVPARSSKQTVHHDSES